MVSSASVPWHDRPPREFPIKRWLRQRYGFTVPTSIFARYTAAPFAPWQPPRREFPAKRWARGQRAGG